MEDYNNTYKAYNFLIKVVKKTKTGEVVVRSNASMETDNHYNNFQLKSVAGFIDDMKAAGKLYKMACKKDYFCEITLTVGTYQVVPEYIDYSFGHPIKSNLKTVNFECWEYAGYPQSDDGFKDDNGKYNFYLRPDERYTEEWRDLIFSADDPFKELAESIGI